MAATRSRAEASASAQDAGVLAEVLAAARTPCPTADIAYDAECNPSSYDELTGVLDQPRTRVVLVKLAKLMPDSSARRTILGSNYTWWRGLRLGDGYAHRRGSIVEFLESVSSRFAPAAPPDFRIEPKQAIECGSPDHGLPPTPKSTFYRWAKTQRNWPRLGIEKKDKWQGQPVLVTGLLQLHASNRRRTKLAPRAPNAGLAGKRKGRA